MIQGDVEGEVEWKCVDNLGSRWVLMHFYSQLPATHDQLGPQWLRAVHSLCWTIMCLCVWFWQRATKGNCQKAHSGWLPFPSHGFDSKSSVAFLSPSSLHMSIISNSTAQQTVSLYSSPHPLPLYKLSHSLPHSRCSVSLEYLLYKSDWPSSDLVSCNHTYSDCGHIKLRQTASIVKLISNGYQLTTQDWILLDSSHSIPPLQRQQPLGRKKLNRKQKQLASHWSAI